MSTNYEVGAGSYNNWDFYNSHVHSDLQQGRFISAETTLVAAGFPSIEETLTSSATPQQPSKASASDQVYPIGLLETIGVQQSKQIQRIFEIGSARSYFIPGRVIGSFNLGRTFFNGNSLLRVLYSYANLGLTDGATTVTPLITEAANDPQKDLLRDPGYNQFFIDMTSDLFSRPFGLAIYCKDSLGNTSNAFFMENCYVQGHQITISSGSVLIMEGASAQFERAIPIKMINDVVQDPGVA